MKQEIYNFIRRNRLTRQILNLSHFLNTTPVCMDEVPAKSKCLVLAPHPDDETLGCGGTLKQIVSHRGSFDVVFLSGSHKPRREEEAREACKILGASNLYFLSGKDTQLHLELQLASEVTHLITTHGYSIIFCPWIYERHADHVAAFKILKQVLGELKNPSFRIWLYEVWTPLIPNRMVDITATFEAKKKAISVYTSQTETTAYLEAFSGLARYRGIQLAHSKYAEAFLEGDSHFILSLK